MIVLASLPLARGTIGVSYAPVTLRLPNCCRSTGGRSSVSAQLSGLAAAMLGAEFEPIRTLALVQCAALFCTYPAAVAKAALARVTLARMSFALAVQMNGLGSMF